MQNTFFVHFFAFVLHDHNVKLPETSQLHVLWRKCCTFSCSLYFSLPLIFTLHWWPLAFLTLLRPLQNFHIVISTKNVSFVFYLSLQISVAIFLVELRWPAAYFLFFLGLSLALHSNFVDMTINLSLILYKTRIQRQFPLSVFVFIDSLVVSASQDASSYVTSRNDLELHLGCHTC